jgi:transcriptional regulator with XRE-family HTH domain
MKEKLAERIRMTRLMRSLSQQNMADELGLTVASYSNIERGVTELTVVRLYAISEILGVTVQYFLKLEEEQPYGVLQDSKNTYIENSANSQLTEILTQLKQQQLEIEKLYSELNKLKK